MVEAFWTDIFRAFAAIDAGPGVRAVVVASTGKHFSARGRCPGTATS